MSDFAESNAELARKYLGRDRLFENNDVVSLASENVLGMDDVMKILAGIDMVILRRLSNIERMLNKHGINDAAASGTDTSYQKADDIAPVQPVKSQGDQQDNNPAKTKSGSKHRQKARAEN